MPWLRLRTKVSAKDAESIGECLQAAGAVAVSLLPDDEQDAAVVEPAPGRTPLWNTLRLDGLFPLDADLTTLPRLDFAVDFVADRNWSETWRDGLAPLRFGRLLVVPASSQAASASDDVLVRLDPGLAFGTGTHPTTALCLAGWPAGRWRSGAFSMWVRAREFWLSPPAGSVPPPWQLWIAIPRHVAPAPTTPAPTAFR